MAFLAAGLAVYYPCLEGQFVSDDIFAVLNPYVTPLSAERVLELFSPYGTATTMHSEYRPIWFLLHALERHVFGDVLAAYHITNVVLHCIVSGLLVLLFARSGLPKWGAVLGGTLFLVHPANVEAVAWISQLTSDAALALALGALLLEPRWRPAAFLCFALALPTKPLAMFALPVAALFAWVDRGEDTRGWKRWAWLGAWLGALIAYGAIERIAAHDVQYGVSPMHPDAVVVARTIVANFLRYVVMSATGYGLAAFQQAQLALSWLDPWWLGGAVVLVLLAWRTAYTISRRMQEGVYWAWAIFAFAPVSQIVPFTHPTADRYLYFILPGFLGGALLAAHAASLRLPRLQRTRVLRLAAALAMLLAVAFAAQARQRAGLWVSFETLAQDSTRYYPNGLWAHLLRSRVAAQAGDGERSAAELHAAFELGHREYETVVSDPAYAGVLRNPTFQRVLIEMADWWINRVRELEEPNQMQLYKLASAYYLRGDFVETKAMLERALAVGGPLDARIRTELSRFEPRRSP